jgi:hypothetical protein
MTEEKKAKRIKFLEELNEQEKKSIEESIDKARKSIEDFGELDQAIIEVIVRNVSLTKNSVEKLIMQRYIELINRNIPQRIKLLQSKGIIRDEDVETIITTY